MSKSFTINVLNKTFHDAHPLEVLRDVLFNIDPEKFVCVLGPSGCGKSTLLRLISGLDTDFQGSIILGGRTVKSPARDCGIIFQEHRLLPWLSVKDNIQFSMYSNQKKGEEIVDSLLRLLDLKNFANAYPHQLSGGMAQRVALARSLANLPDLLLLDEPFSALDEITRRRLQEELQHILSQKKTTALMVTHNIEEAIFLSDRILVMSKRPGRIVKSFSVDLPKPRIRTDEAFIALQTKILTYMRDDLKLF